MKRLKLIFLVAVVLIVWNMQSLAQNVLPDVTVKTVNYKYIKSVNDTNAALPVRMLERRAATFDVKNSDFYEDEYDNYFVSFYLPAGSVLAAYDQEGKLLRTAERFKNIALPPAVRQSVATRFPQWSINKDVYLVNYYDAPNARKVYKLLLQNGNKRLRVRTTETGEFL
jgi:hypothetical protein